MRKNKKYQQAKKQRVAELHRSVKQSIQELAQQMRQGHSPNLRRYLDYASRLHNYSFHNILLAASQRLDLTQLAGIKKWNQLGRRVRPGEKGILILAPIPARKLLENEEEDTPLKDVVAFRTVHVFDLSQTEGQPLPSIIHAHGNPGSVLPALEQAIAADGIQVRSVNAIPGSPNARGASAHGNILIRNDLTDADRFRALLHELAHEKLHWTTRTDRTQEETEADATAYVVCRHYGIECDTADYLALHEATPESLLERLETIRSAANQVITAIQQRLEKAATFEPPHP